jgi:hypothetical protein
MSWVCKYCESDKQRVRSGYDYIETKCDCSLTQKTVSTMLFVMGLILLSPLLVSMGLITGIIFLVEKVFDCLD